VVEFGVEGVRRETVVHNCKDVDAAFGGGKNWAGFVQVIQGHAKDQVAMRRRMTEMEGQLRISRPDVMGAVVAWHGTAGDFTQAVYFTSAQAAHEREAIGAHDELAQEFADMIDGQPTFFDLAPPDFD
jgi:hypothetical protein